MVNSKLQWNYKVYPAGAVIPCSDFTDTKKIKVLVSIGATGFLFITDIEFQGYYELGNANAHTRIIYNGENISVYDAYIGADDYKSVTYLTLFFR